MLNPSQFHNLVSGRSSGLTASLARALLRLGEVPYTAAVRWRNHRFDQAHLNAVRVPVPVISIGNLTLGGTGKTPLVQWMAESIRQRGVRVALVSRGYGARRGMRNDEALELDQKLPGMPHLQNPDRVAAALEAIDKHAAQLILLDDGFQHRRLARDLDIVLVDALQPWGYGHVFPRGALREPLEGLARADIVALSRADLVRPEQRAALRKQALAYAPAASWCEIEQRPQELVDCSGQKKPLEALLGRRLAAFCGIGNPVAFRSTLAQCRFNLNAFREFADHYNYQSHDLRSLAAWAEAAHAEAIVCTHKDLVKIGISHIGGRPLWAVTVAVGITSGRDELEARLGALLAERCPVTSQKP